MTKLIPMHQRILTGKLYEDSTVWHHNMTFHNYCSIYYIMYIVHNYINCVPITEKSDNQETITAGKSEANLAKLKVALLPAPQVDGSASSKVPMMTTVPNTKEPFTGIV